MNVKAEMEVPGLDNIVFHDEQNENFLKESEVVENKKFKQFLKLKTQNIPNKPDISTEKLFIRGKTLKGFGNKLNFLDVADTTYTSKHSNAEKRNTKRNDILRRLTDYKSPNNLDVNNTDLLYSVSNKDINSEEEDKILEILKNHFLFQNFNNLLLKLIIDDLNGFQVEAGTLLFKEGEEGNCFFIIKSGKMEVSVEGVMKKILQEGDCFGELALIQRCVRTTTLKALTDCEFYVMEGEIYRDLNQNLARTKIGDVLFYLDFIPWLKTLDMTSKNILACLTTLNLYETGQPVILRKRKDEDKIFLVKQGVLTCRYKGDEIKKYYSREYFSEKWVFLDTTLDFDPFPYDVYALEKSACYIIQKTSLEEALGMGYREFILYSIFRDSLSKSKFFTSFFIESHYNELFSKFKLQYYNKGDKMFDAENSINKKISYRYEVLANKGELYGEEVINSNQDLQSNLIANPECLVLETTWELIRQQLQKYSKNSSMDIFKRINKLKKISIFKHLSESRLLEICHLMAREKFDTGEFIFLENTKGDKFYLLNKGRVRVLVQGKFVRELEEGSCFGELSLLNEEKRTASIMAIDKVQCYSLTKEKFLEIIDDNMMDYLKKKMCLEDPEITLSDLYYLSFIGKGKFGTVFLAHNCTYLYAVKVIPKKTTEKQKSLAKYLLSEKRIMLSLDHPFIIKLVKTLKNDNFCYFLLEFVNGINMEDYLTSRKVKKNVYETKFYGACLLLMLDYLNSKNIAHRDIKPNNIMVDRNGYLKLIDFGTAKKIIDFTHTVIGTPHYTAPEVLMGKGYSFSCDFWSVGVTMYYIFYGVTPFGNNANDIMEIYKEILHK